MDWKALRKRAEMVLHQEPLSCKSGNESDVRGLIEELELRGEELRLKNIELKELFHRYAALYQAAPVGFLTLDRGWVIVEANEAALEALGWTKIRLLHKTFSRFIFPEDHPIYLKLLRELNKTPKNTLKTGLRLRRGFGPPFFAHMEIVPFPDCRGRLQGWLIAFIDISQQKSAEQGLRQAVSGLKTLSARLISIQEEERKQIARDLHDSFGQTLAAVKFGIENTLLSPNLPDEARNGLRRLVPLMQGAIAEVRNVYTGLRPSILDDMGIIATIGSLVRETNAAFTSLHVDSLMKIEERDVDEELKIILFRVVQEALANVTKHSGAKRVSLSIVKSGAGGIELELQDDGSGFDFEEAGRDGKGVGLLGMRERVELSGGTLAVSSQKGMGTRITAKWEKSP
jgi:PAS domain S-box-containing protein